MNRANDHQYSLINEKISEKQKELEQHHLFELMKSHTPSTRFIKKLLAMQLGYNIYFISALANMRKVFCGHDKFLCSFLDPHMASEFGADIELVDLHQKGVTHIKMIFSLIDSMNMSPQEKCNWGQDCNNFFNFGIVNLIGGDDKAVALGALFADEIYANCWFSHFYKFIKKFSIENDLELDLEFFSSHANEIEPAHQDHAILLRSYCHSLNLNELGFNEGIELFGKEIVILFDSLANTLLSKN
ncbi:hypothetical protein [Pseudoalteromonas sp. NC201]|uniref:hypothetical protein n=1 Tax=Pseudoalteromonas sp. NC201 TaxID=1514074 RepID=UPI000C7E0368|nr:hypothetical protein [Pseudoalteromonas sp. NC201]AUJ69332.1 hypothetical protein PNC201_05095 [Pseudoalteromonas sp. NC201]